MSYVARALSKFCGGTIGCATANVINAELLSLRSGRVCI